MAVCGWSSACPLRYRGFVVLSELWRDQASIEAHKLRPTHSHAWEREVVANKRVLIYEVIDSPRKAGER
jgi:quinol monooxygenase YgiN